MLNIKKRSPVQVSVHFPLSLMLVIVLLLCNGSVFFQRALYRHNLAVLKVGKCCIKALSHSLSLNLQSSSEKNEGIGQMSSMHCLDMKSIICLHYLLQHWCDHLGGCAGVVRTLPLLSRQPYMWIHLGRVACGDRRYSAST